MIASRSREGWFRSAILSVAALEPPRRFAPPLLTQEGNTIHVSHNFQILKPQCSMNMPKAYMVLSSVLKYMRPLAIVIPESAAGAAMRLRLE